MPGLTDEDELGFRRQLDEIILSNYFDADAVEK